MKKTTFLFLSTISALIYNCSVADDIKETADVLECANLIVKIDEKYDRQDRSCSEIKSDVNKILKTCKNVLSDDEKAKLQFYADNCDVDNKTSTVQLD